MFILLISLLIDITIGELPAFIHPVVYMGYIGKLFEKSKHARFLLGMFALLLEILFWLFLCKTLLSISKCFEIYFLTSTFSIKSLYSHVKRCYEDDVEKLRKNVSYIVSRDVSKLNKEKLYSAALESLSENISDGIVGPLFYYLIFGIYGALLYRVVNTYDALFGYRNERYEWFGKFPARFDDVLNFIPARITALLIALFNFKGAFSYLKKYRRLKINSMYPMSAFAGALNLGFEKVGVYKLEGKPVEKEDILKGLSLYTKVVFVWIAIVLFTVVLKTKIF